MRIKVTKLTPNDKTGTPESFEQQYARRKAPARQIQAPRPTLTPIENKSMQERLEDFGLNEN